MKKGALLVGNWKAFVESPRDALALLKGIEKTLPRGMRSHVVLCPPAVFLGMLRERYRGERIQFGVQTVSALSGAHTGELSVSAAYAAGARYAIIGHAERRVLGESDADIALKVRAALDARITPIICIGEKERDREGAFFNILSAMISESLARVDARELHKLVIAYEPVWAIGAATAPDARVVQEAILYIRKTLVDNFGREAGLRARLLYGGAVDSGSAQEFWAGPAQGFLVGRASTMPSEFAGIIRACEL